MKNKNKWPLLVIFLILGTAGIYKSLSASPIFDVCTVAACDGVTDDHAAIQTVLNIGGDVSIPAITLISSTALNLKCPSRLKGVPGKSFIKFTGSTDGLVIPSDGSCNNGSDSSIEGVTLECANTTCGKAINGNAPSQGISRFTLRDLSWSTDSFNVDTWAYDIYANNWESSNWYNLKSNNYLTGIYLENSSNALRIYGVEFDQAGSRANRCVQVVHSGSTEDAWFYGGTCQGNVNQSALNVAGQSHFIGWHIENTNATPTDGADVVVGDGSHTIYNTSFDQMQGGSYQFGVSGGNLYGANISHSAVSSINVTTAAFFTSLEAISFGDTISDDSGNYTYMHNVQKGGDDAFPFYLGCAPTFGCGSPKALTVDHNNGTFTFGFPVRLASQTPSGPTAACVKGTFVWDANFIYLCVDTNTWKRSAFDQPWL